MAKATNKGINAVAKTCTPEIQWTVNKPNSTIKKKRYL